MLDDLVRFATSTVFTITKENPNKREEQRTDTSTLLALSFQGARRCKYRWFNALYRIQDICLGLDLFHGVVLIRVCVRRNYYVVLRRNVVTFDCAQELTRLECLEFLCMRFVRKPPHREGLTSRETRGDWCSIKILFCQNLWRIFNSKRSVG